MRPDARWLTVAACASFGALAAAPALVEAFSGAFVVQDDARQHVFWMQRFMDPELFEGDLAADYFAEMAPPGYTAFYRALAFLGLEPLTAAKIVPFVLSIGTAALAGWFLFALIPVPAVAFSGAAALGLNLWLLDALSNATPRAFAPVLFLAFAIAWLRRSPIGSALSLAAASFVYPAVALVGGGALVASEMFRRSPDRRLGLAAVGVLAAAAPLLPLLIRKSSFGPVLTRAEALALPELQPGGRSAFFDPDPPAFWLCGERSGILPTEWCWMQRLEAPWLPLSILALVFFAAIFIGPAVARSRASRLLLFTTAVVVSSVALFGIAHLVLFRLHLPNRFTQHTLRIVCALSVGVAVGLAATRSVGWLRTRSRIAASAAAALILAAVLTAPILSSRVAWYGYVHGSHPDIYRYLQRTPKYARIASLEPEADNVPSFTGRQVLVSSEVLLPYHRSYHHRMRERAAELSRALRATEPGEVQDFVSRWGVTHFVVGVHAPADSHLSRRVSRCSVARDGTLAVLDAACAGDGRLAGREVEGRGDPR